MWGERGEQGGRLTNEAGNLVLKAQIEFLSLAFLKVRCSGGRVNMFPCHEGDPASLKVLTKLKAAVGWRIDWRRSSEAANFAG